MKKLIYTTLSLLWALPVLANFTDITPQSGIQAGVENWPTSRAAFGDFNNDGLVDLVKGSKLYQNLGNGRFRNVSGAMGYYGEMAIFGDFNGDGYADIYSAHRAGILYINQAGQKFERKNIPENTVQDSHGVTAADLDNDGDLDIYVASFEEWKNSNTYAKPDFILWNDGEANFTLQWMSSPQNALPSRGVTICDINEDGRIDLDVSVYRLGPNQIWMNQGSGRFTNRASHYGLEGSPYGSGYTTGNGRRVRAFYGHTISSAHIDLNNDSFEDLIVGNFAHGPVFQDRVQIFRNHGPAAALQFENKTANAGLIYRESYASLAPADYDNDGRIDFFLSTAYAGDQASLYRNLGNFRFSDQAQAQGISSNNNYQAAWADIDNDGDLDFLSGGRLYRNNGNSHKWLRINLQGTASNPDAVGAKVTVTKSGTEQLTRRVRIGVGASNQNEKTLHFGLGDFNQERIQVRIHWPAGSISNHRLEINQTHSITE